MLRKTTKITALLVSAASIISTNPVMATEKLNQRDATINEAVAFDNGKYVYYGYRNDDDTSIYYNDGNNDKDKKINDDLDEYKINFKDAKQVKYGEKYVFVTENGNSDEYLINLSTGDIDDDSAESKQDSAQSNFISKAKKAERYDCSTSDYKIDSNRLFRNQFGDVWYQYVMSTTGANVDNLIDKDGQKGVTTSAAVGVDSFGGENPESSVFTGFFDDNGKYIEASYLANLKIYNPRKDKATLIENYGKIYQDEALKADLIGMKPIAQDKNYIYTFTTVRVTYYKYNSAEGKYIFTDNDESNKPLVSDQYFIQKISKAQGDKVDGAYVPKDVESFQVDGGEGIFKDNDSKSETDERNDAYEVLSGDIDRYNKMSDDSDIIYSVKDGDLYATVLKEDDKIHTYRIKLTTDKVDIEGSKLANDLNLGSNDFTNRTSTSNDGKDIDVKLAYRISDDDLDYDIPKYNHDDTNTDMGGISVDTDGNTWAVHSGKVYMFDGNNFKEKYSTDRSYDRLDVYDENSLIAWSQDTDSYTTVKEGKQQTIDDAKQIDPSLIDKPAKTGWDQQTDGTWVLYDAQGNRVTGWAFAGNKWYNMDANGVMKTGWVNDNGTWYYCDASGAMVTGWFKDNNGVWYYLQANGSMKTGWLNDNGTWYFLKDSGAMAVNEYIDGYYVNGLGVWVQ